MRLRSVFKRKGRTTRMSKKNELAYKICDDGMAPVEMMGLPVLRLPLPMRFSALGAERRINMGVSFSCPVLVYPAPMLKSYTLDLKESGQMVLPDEPVTVTLVSSNANVDVDDGVPAVVIVPLAGLYDVLVRSA